MYATIDARTSSWDLACAIMNVVSRDFYGMSCMLDAMDYEDLALDLQWQDAGDQEKYTREEILGIVREAGLYPE